MQCEPRYIESRLNTAALLLKLGRTNDAIARYRIVLDLEPRNVTARQALISLSDLMQADGRESEAAATCAIVARRNPRDVEAQIKLAFSYPVILDSTESAREARARLLNSLGQLSARSIRLDDPFRQLCRTYFYFAYQGLDDLEQQKVIARFHLAACPAP
jgi:predicted Zn-dependent protease